MEKPPKKMTVSDVAKNIPNWMAYDMEKVKGVFRNMEQPGAPVSFNLKEYPGQEYDKWTFEDGEKYEIPRYVARHLSRNCYWLENKHLPGETGQFGVRMIAHDGRSPLAPQMYTTRKVYRYSFNPTDFSDDDLDFQQSNIVAVSIK
jgi:hypothetical protein